MLAFRGRGRRRPRLRASFIHRSLGALDIVSADNRAAVHARAKQLTGALTLLAYGIGGGRQRLVRACRASASASLRWDPRAIGRWLATHGINIVVIVAGAYRGRPRRQPGDRAPAAQDRPASRRESDLEWQRRASTIGGILTSVVTRRRGVRRHPDAAARAGDRRRAHPDGCRHRRARDRLRRAEPGARRHLGVLPDSRGSGPDRRPGADQRRHRRSSSRSTCGRSSCATAKGPCRCFPTARSRRSPTSASISPTRWSTCVSPTRENIDRVIGTMREVGASMERDDAWRVADHGAARRPRGRIARRRGGHAAGAVQGAAAQSGEGRQRAAEAAAWARSSAAASARIAADGSQCGYFSSSVSQRRERALPAVADDLVVSSPALAFFEARLPDVDPRPRRGHPGRPACSHLERHGADRIAVGRQPETVRHEEALSRLELHDGAAKHAAQASQHVVAKLGGRPLERVRSEHPWRRHGIATCHHAPSASASKNALRMSPGGATMTIEISRPGVAIAAPS